MSKNSGPADKSSTGRPPLKIEDLHHEVSEWSSEHDSWLKDIDLWRREQRLVKLILYKMERALPDQNNLLDEHTRIIRNHKQRVGAYEKKLQDLMAGDKLYPEKFDALWEEHQLLKDLHLRERERHESFRHAHLAAMSELNRLIHVLEQAERQ